MNFPEKQVRKIEVRKIEVRIINVRLIKARIIEVRLIKAMKIEINRGPGKRGVDNRGPTVRIFGVLIQSTPDNSNLQGKSKKVRVIGNSKEIAGSKEKKQFLVHSEHSNHI